MSRIINKKMQDEINLYNGSSDCENMYLNMENYVKKECIDQNDVDELISDIEITFDKFLDPMIDLLKEEDSKFDPDDIINYGNNPYNIFNISAVSYMVRMSIYNYDIFSVFLQYARVHFFERTFYSDIYSNIIRKIRYEQDFVKFAKCDSIKWSYENVFDFFKILMEDIKKFPSVKTIAFYIFKLSYTYFSKEEFNNILDIFVDIYDDPEHQEICTNEFLIFLKTVPYSTLNFKYVNTIYACIGGDEYIRERIFSDALENNEFTLDTFKLVFYALNWNPRRIKLHMDRNNNLDPEIKNKIILFLNLSL